ncbi:DUF1329 domain-containing protein [Paraburkholderia sp. HP33-1]|uniref:DUF1329 domain-containing protein n=1 Tax=Paraburkholderia sp. HP33-1 TaxID=2883243 RepID=UPI001F3C4239|nr:DUF1329 domain-containing protein [Paraburkholderia sp. HP33-1]
MAAVSADEAAHLGKDLTPSGAERAGNKDGTIPAWDADWKGPSYPKEAGRLPDPFPGEKPLYAIDSKNMSQYADKLSPGTKELLQRYPDYKMTVYPSHRTFDVPDFVNKNTLWNATHATTKDGGTSIENALGGIAFPIPKTGNEVIWNFLYRYIGSPAMYYVEGFLWDPSGHKILLYSIRDYTEAPIYDEPDTPNDTYQKRLALFDAPARQVGDQSLMLMKTTSGANGNTIDYMYTQGQRRVRLAPETAYDTPATDAASSFYCDERGLWEGSMDRFDFVLKGKKEMYIPYNANKFEFMPADEAFGPQHPKTDALRWELHRVWVVEATLKNGMRHAESKKVFYLDEDRWEISLYDAYDPTGKLFKTAYTIPIHDWENKAGGVNPVVFFDLAKGQYVAAMHFGETKGIVRIKRWPASRLTPDAMAANGIR